MTAYSSYHNYSGNQQERQRRVSSRRQPKRKKGARISTLITLLGVAAAVVVLTNYHGHAHAKAAGISPLSAAQVAAVGVSINNLIANYPDDSIAVYATDLNTGQAVHYGFDGAFTAASTAKLISACDFLHKTETGSESLSEDLDGTSTVSLLESMIVDSDDTAWQTINDELTHADLLAYSQSIGLQNYDPDDNTLTAGDIQNLLVQLYKGKLLDAADTQLLLGYMRRANYRDYIVPAVPAGLVIYHKAGVVDDEIHDAALIKDGNHVLALTIFTSGNGSYDTAARTQAIQAIAHRLVTAFLIKNQPGGRAT